MGTGRATAARWSCVVMLTPPRLCSGRMESAVLRMKAQPGGSGGRRWAMGAGQNGEGEAARVHGLRLGAGEHRSQVPR